MGASENKPEEHLCIALLAHVDAGKTTLSEAILYQSGVIRRLGRVDKRDAYLDTDEIERERGITIFSKQAVFPLGEKTVTLLDTPGHVDFSAEMERTLSVLDYAVLVVSGVDGVQGHTRTLWRLLEKYEIPVFLFINKMDQDGTDREAILGELKNALSQGCVDFSDTRKERFFENIAVCGEEELLDRFLDCGVVSEREICRLIADRSVFPCFFGSALKLDGVEEFLGGLCAYTVMPEYGQKFAARVFKISRDGQGNRLAHIKVTGGELSVRQVIGSDKVNQIRIYSGEKYDSVNAVGAGSVCAVTGLSGVSAGDGLGAQRGIAVPVLEPVLTYQIRLPDGCDAALALPKLRQLEEEEPELHIVYNEATGELLARLMGEVQIEILKRLLAERFGLEAEFDEGKIVYKETIRNTVEGVGHFEPLRHYAEVHLLMESLEAGSGLVFETKCSEDLLEKNWQRLVLTHLREREHKGVLTGAAITDMKITLIAGRAHRKHTEGGDFRQATYRAVRQGLMQADTMLLEPYYRFCLRLPKQFVGRAMTDMERMHGNVGAPHIEGAYAVLTGNAPVACIRNYAKEVVAYAKGEGQLDMEFGGYAPCHNTEEVAQQIGYDALRDVEHTADSVFCAHGAGVVVSFDKVFDYMHVEAAYAPKKEENRENLWQRENREKCGEAIGTEEIDAILERTFQANSKDKPRAKNGVLKRQKPSFSPVSRTYQPKKKEGEYLLVDGYNIIFAWEELKELAKVNIDGARGRLLDLLCNYQGLKGCSLIAVFDAYRVQGHQTEIYDYHNIHVVFTKEAETADQYIEKFAHENGKKYNVTVATSDGLEQIIIRGAGCALISARELEEEIRAANENAGVSYGTIQPSGKSYLFDALSGETREQIERLRKERE